jgi:hypothetical protein
MRKGNFDLATVIVVGALVIMAAIICGSLASQLWYR